MPEQGPAFINVKTHTPGLEPDVSPVAHVSAPESVPGFSFPESLSPEEDRQPFGAAWETLTQTLATDPSPNAAEVRDWLASRKNHFLELDTPHSTELLELHQFHDACSHQLEQERAAAEIRVAARLRQKRYTSCTETNTPPLPVQNDSAWAGERFRHMLYMSFLLEQKGYVEGSTTESVRNLADMVHEDLLFNGNYPNAGNVNEAEFASAKHAHTNWGHIDYLKQRYNDLHLGEVPGNSVIRWNWTDTEHTQATTQGEQVLTELRDAYQAPKGLEGLSLEELKQVRRDIGKTIKDTELRKDAMTLTYLDRRLAWVEGVFDDFEAATASPDGIVHDRLVNRLDQDLTFIVASALRNMQHGSLNHTAMITNLIEARLHEAELTERIAAETTHPSQHIDIAKREVRIAETIAIEIAREKKDVATLQKLAQQAISLAQVS